MQVKNSGDGSVMGYQFFQGEGVLDSEPIGVIVEINEYGLAFFSPFLDVPCPLFQFLIRIIRAIEHLATVKAEVDEVGGNFFYKRKT